MVVVRCLERSLLDVASGHVLSQCLHPMDHQGYKLDQNDSEVEDREGYGEETVVNVQELEVRQVYSEKEHHPYHVDDQHGQKHTVTKPVQLLL